jgi:hypothetical protein
LSHGKDVEREAEMSGRDIYSQQRQAVVGAPVIGIGLGFLLAAWSCKVVGMTAQGCELVDSTKWAALVVLRWIMLLADHQGVPAYLYDNAGLLQHLPKIAASLWPLLCALVHQAW